MRKSRSSRSPRINDHQVHLNDWVKPDQRNLLKDLKKSELCGRGWDLRPPGSFLGGRHRFSLLGLQRPHGSRAFASSDPRQNQARDRTPWPSHPEGPSNPPALARARGPFTKFSCDPTAPILTIVRPAKPQPHHPSGRRAEEACTPFLPFSFPPCVRLGLSGHLLLSRATSTLG